MRRYRVLSTGEQLGDKAISTPVGESKVIANRDGDTSLVARRLDRLDILAAEDDRRRPDIGPLPLIVGVTAVAGRSTQSLVQGKDLRKRRPSNKQIGPD